MARFKTAKNQVIIKDGKEVAKAENGVIETRNQGLIDYMRFLGFREMGREYKRTERREG